MCVFCGTTYRYFMGLSGARFAPTFATTTRVQIYLAVTDGYTDLLSLPHCERASVMSFAIISLSVTVRAGQTAVFTSPGAFKSDVTSNIFQHVKILDRNALMDVFFICF